MRLFFNAYRCPGLYHIRMRRLTFLVSIFLGICMFLWLGPEILRCGFGATCLYGNLFKFRNAATTGIPLCNSSGCLGTPGITSTRNIAKVMPWCPEYPPELVGPVVVMIEPISELAVAAKYTNLLSGGSWHPEDCDARQNVALIIPFRNRSAHLNVFLDNIHPILQRQKLSYHIFVVEQAGNVIFNRALLMNVGYSEAVKAGHFDCFVFHDVDLLPENDKNLYCCGAHPRHLSVAVDKFDYRLPYNRIMGGATAFTGRQFEAVNGFPNLYWGWGGEDDDLSKRVYEKGFSILRHPPEVARYKMISHGSDAKNPENPVRWHLLRTASVRFTKDGLNSLNYKVISQTFLPTYTRVLVDIGEPVDSMVIMQEGSSWENFKDLFRDWFFYL